MKHATQASSTSYGKFMGPVRWISNDEGYGSFSKDVAIEFDIGLFLKNELGHVCFALCQINQCTRFVQQDDHDQHCNSTQSDLFISGYLH